MSRSANGVAKKHGEVSRALWHKMFPEVATDEVVPITHVTNGVHPATWIAPLFKGLYRERIGKNWKEISRHASAWQEVVEHITDKDIWETHQSLKELLIAFIRQRILVQDSGTIETINEHKETSDLLSPNVLTIGFARRVAAYKRWNLILQDVERLLRMVDDTERPVQFVFAGKAHPQDLTAKTILQELMSINHDSQWQNRAVFIEDYDQEVARYLVQGVDVWLNVPRRPLEASGTSGMKAAMNGVLNLSILDGWWIEGYNGENGFAIGDLSQDEDPDKADAEDADALYTLLENLVIPLYYDTDEQGSPAKWIKMMRDSIRSLTPQFSSDRMVREYLDRVYKLV
jgi:starch phosphorylase